MDVNLGTKGWTITNTAALSSAELITPQVNSDVLNVLAPDVSVTQQASPNPVEPGQTLAFRLSFGNASGALTATNVILTNTVPLSLTNPITLTMNADKAVTATFDQSDYPVYLPLVLRQSP